MRFEGSFRFEAPPTAVIRALRDPRLLEVIIPDCRRFEIQPGYHPELNGDVTFGFEIGTADVATGAEPIVGWLHITGEHALTFSLSLDDGVTMVRTNGTLRMHQNGNGTDMHYTLVATLPGRKNIRWSAGTVADTEAIIAAACQTIEQFLARFLPQSTPNAASTTAGADATGVQVLATTPRGQVLLVAPDRVPAPTQSMLRRLRQVEEARQLHQRQLTALWLTGALAVAVSCLAAWQALKAIRV